MNDATPRPWWRLLPSIARTVFAWCAVLLPFAFLFFVMLGRLSANENGNHDSTGTDDRLIIAAGRETEVMAFLGNDARSFAGMPVSNIAIDHDTLVLQMDGSPTEPCDETRGVSPPGRIFIGPHGSAPPGAPSAKANDLLVSWVTCGISEMEAQKAGDALAGTLADRPHDRVWSVIEGHHPHGVGGILSPFLKRMRAENDPTRLLRMELVLSMMLALLAAVVAPSSKSEPTPRSLRPTTFSIPSTVLIALLLVGAALRLRAASHLPLDGDEPWAFPSPHSIVSDDHDAWVHPPMHRALQQAWVRVIGWHEGRSLLTLRAISVVASVSALALILARLRARFVTIGGIALLALAVAPAIVTSSVVARPYALAALAVTLVLVSLFPGAGRSPSRLGWFLSLLAVGLAAWTDLVAGLAAGIVLSIVVLQSLMRFRLRAAPSAVLAFVAIVSFCAPLLPGALASLHEQVTPATHGENTTGPDLRATNGAGRGEVISLLGAIAELDVLGSDPSSDPGLLGAFGVVVLLGAFTIVGVSGKRTHDVAAVLVPCALFLLCVIVGTRLGLRARNILFLPLASAFLVARAIPQVIVR